MFIGSVTMVQVLPEPVLMRLTMANDLLANDDMDGLLLLALADDEMVTALYVENYMG